MRQGGRETKTEDEVKKTRRTMTRGVGRVAKDGGRARREEGGDAEGKEAEQYDDQRDRETQRDRKQKRVNINFRGFLQSDLAQNEALAIP